MRRPSSLAIAALVAGSGMFAVADATPREPPPEPSDDPQRSPRYIGADYGAEPGRAVYPEDRQRMAAADDKRARKAAKRLALRSATDQSEKDSVR